MSTSSSQQVNLPLRGSRSWLGWLRVIVGAALVVAAAGAVAVWITLQPRQFSVTLTPEAIPADELGRVVALLHEADRLEKKWTSEEASDANLDLLVKHLRANPQARRWHELRRSGSEPQIGLLNGALSMLAEQLPHRPPAELAGLPDELLRDQLRLALMEAGRSAHQEAVRRLLQSPEFERSVGPAVSPPCPPPPSAWRKWVYDLYHRPIDDRDRWAAAVLAAVQAHRSRIEELHRLYESVTRFSEAVLARAGGHELIVNRLRYDDPVKRPVVWRNGTAAVDVGVMLRTPDREKEQAIVRDVGIRLLELPLAMGPDGQPRPGWPPVTAAAGDEPFQAYLRGSGFPGGLRVDAVRIEAAGSPGRPTLRATFRVQSDDFPGWSAEQSVTVWDDGPALAQVAEAARAILDSLRRHVASVEQMFGVTVRVRPADQDSFRVRLTDPKLPEVELGLAIDPDGRPLWLGPVTLADLERVTDWLVAQNPQLAPYRTVLRVEGVELDRTGKLTGRLVLSPASTSDAPAPEPVRIPWQSWGDRPLQVPLPPGAPPPPQVAPEPPRDLDIAAVMRDEIRTRFPQIADRTEVARIGDAWVIGLRIADWPVLRLGPVSPTTEEEVRRAVAELLSAESVKAAARTQWQGDGRGINHPVFGLVRPTITRWAPQDGEVEIQCQAPLWDEHNRKAQPEKQLFLIWPDVHRLVDGAWRRLEDEAVRQAEKSVREMLPRINVAASLVFGGPVLLEPDPDETTGRFVRLSSPSVRLKGRVLIPLRVSPGDGQRGGLPGSRGMLEIEVKGITLSFSSLEVPEDVQVVYHRTFVTPLAFALSDPRLGLRRTPEGYHVYLGVKITPALLAGVPVGPAASLAYGLGSIANLRLDNPWLHLFYLDIEGSARLNAPEFRLQGRVLLLEREAAYADLSLTLPGGDTPPRLAGKIRVGSNNVIAGLPLRLEGNLNIDGGGIDIDGRLDLLSVVRAAAGFRFGEGDKSRSLDGSNPPPEIAIRSHLTAFGVRVDLAGWSRLDFSDYYLHGEVTTEVNFLIGSRTMGIRATVTKNEGVQINTIWEVGGRQVQESFSASSLDQIDWEKLKERIREADRRAHANPPPEPQEHEPYLRPQPRPKAPDSEPTRFLDEDKPLPTGGDVGGPVYDRVVDLIPLDEPINDPMPPWIAFKYFRDQQAALQARRGEGVRNLLDGLSLEKNELGLDHVGRVRGYKVDGKGYPIGFEDRDDAYKCSYALWPEVATDPETGKTRCVRGKILITDHVKRRVLFIVADDVVVRTKDGRKTYDLIDLTPRFRDIKPLYDSDMIAEDQHDRLIFNQRMIRRYADLYTRGFEPTTLPRPVADGYSFQFTAKGDSSLSGEHEAFVWYEGRGLGMLIRRLYVYSPGVPAKLRTEPFYEQLKEQLKKLGDDSLHWLVAYAPGEKPRVALVGRDDRSEAPVLRFKLKDKDGGIPLVPADAPWGRQLEAARLAAELVWRLAIPEAELKGVYFGPRGLALATSTRLWVVPAPEVNARPAGGSGIWFVTWDRLKNWPSPTAAHLPPEWNSSERRAAWVKDPEPLVQAALSDWEAKRIGRVPGVAPDVARRLRDQANRWAADPLGLLIGLGEEWTSQSPAAETKTP